MPHKETCGDHRFVICFGLKKTTRRFLRSAMYLRYLLFKETLQATCVHRLIRKKKALHMSTHHPLRKQKTVLAAFTLH